MTTNENTTTTAQHTPRMFLHQLAPEVQKAMYALHQAATKGLEPSLVELVLIRASQLNHCAFCLDMHTKDAVKAGETTERIMLLSAWEEAHGIYTEKERAALALTEAVTVLTDGFVPDEVYDRAAAHFEPEELARLISTIVTINSWNRIAVTTRLAPGAYEPRG
ncbi:carboxymuconolactone decarboxylase family protein [Streptomyces sp. UNOC14_S4]|uniref:carboxymuconolactone decarboxylase family protein n=1 Tax=Streptomyces sp. UNOC14_S4 TaxID=2872340 RepID=UPI001E539941|nr:carboxymuconolactone decarboxylase family protein [Streptomyces sp. UNOC14_S4]MCC3767720.1 carboxymuconolactone decarboxylase family protein [Streptomyces sp. UNOC14_S4]